MNLIFMGPPGSGKGTQNKFFEDRHGLMPISTGDMFRAAINEKTKVGLEAKTYIDKGQLVPDEVTVNIVKERLAKKDFKNGFILDGFPRTINQAKAFDKILNELDLRLDKVVLISVPNEKLMRRLTGRRTCKACKTVFNIVSDGNISKCKSCGGELYQRDDDREDVIRNRLETYDRQTLPLRDFYKNKDILLVIDGTQSPDDTYNDILSKLGL